MKNIEYENPYPNYFNSYGYELFLAFLKNDFDTDGDKVFLRNGNTTLNDYDMVIIDECSMIPLGMIYEIIKEAEKIISNNLFKYI